MHITNNYIKALHAPGGDIDNRGKLPQPPRSMPDNIVLNYEKPQARTILLSELIYAYKDCRSTSFNVPKYETMRNCANAFKYVLKKLEMSLDLDTRYLAGRHPKSGLILPKHFLRNFPEGADRLKLSKSLFSRGMIEWYDEIGIETSHMANWQTMVIKQKPVKAFIPTNDINEIIKKCESVKYTKPIFYKAYLLAYGLGLRNSEMRRAKWSDLYEDLEGNKCIRIHKPKSGGDFQDRPCDPTFWDKVMEMRNFDDLILNCSQVLIRERFAQFLKEECGVTERFAVHLLRKYCGHRLMRSNGIYPASKALGHKDTKLTDQIYSGLPTISASKIA
jgi:integrase